MKTLTKKNTVFAFAVAAAIALTSACAPPPEPPAGWHQRYLTRDGADVTTITESSHGRIDATAPATNVGGNSRTLFGRTDAPISTNQYSCATVAHSGGIVQEGVAVRMRADGDRHRGITVMKNIFGGVNSVYNVHLWDTTIGGDLPARHIAGFAMEDSVGHGNSDSVPRRLCAKVEGQTLTFKVWPAGNPEPEWNDPTASRSLVLPSDWVFDGQPGLYIGHLEANDWAVFTDTVTGTL